MNDDEKQVIGILHTLSPPKDGAVLRVRYGFGLDGETLPPPEGTAFHRGFQISEIGYTHGQIARVFGVSQAYVSLRELRGLSRLRSPERADALKAVLLQSPVLSDTVVNLANAVFTVETVNEILRRREPEANEILCYREPRTQPSRTQPAAPRPGERS